MKEYDCVIVWLDYFNRVLTRSRGRRLGREVCIPDPTLENLAKAVEMAGFSVAETKEGARHPRRPYTKSGYVAVTKTAPKTRMLYRIAPKLARVTRAGKKK
ncbi:MAG: hypothetical protein IS632_01375 [Thaumarchaeota archaeon]|nr:hypothetical protein [Nitrososphaerota archaeon]